MIIEVDENGNKWYRYGDKLLTEEEFAETVKSLRDSLKEQGLGDQFII